MLSDEEKQAVDYLIFHKYENSSKKEDMIDKVIEIIEKQSKEIEELKTDRDKFKKALGKRITYCNELEKDLFENCSNYVVSKDKIKAKIEEYENKIKKIRSKKVINEPEDTIIITRYAHYISVLQSLLEKE